jgi:glycosyltransferase involved in cell wall biosynthesis
MKILMFARRYPPDIVSGTETVFRNLYEQARRRHDVRLVVGYTRERELVPAEALGVDLRGARLGAAHARMWRAGMAEARRFKPDVVLSNSIEAPITGYPTATLVHDLNFGRAGRSASARIRELVYRLRCPKMERIVAVSEATRRAVADIGVDPRHVVVIHNGVDLESFRPSEEAPPTAGRLRLAYPARILPGKGQHVAIDAVARLAPELKARVHLDLVGTVADPVYLEQLRDQARGQPVAFHTEVPAIAPYYQRADLVLFPTLMIEGFGFTAVEGMACGKPVVWSEQPAIREATGGIGFPVPGGDATAIRSVIERMLADPAPFYAAGEAGRAFTARRYGWDRVWGRYERMLMEIVRVG